MTLRLLLTGFSPFPGAPVNPSEVLVRLFDEREPYLGADVEVRPVLLPTSYLAVRERLAAIGETWPPDISLHFGLSSMANGFRLERLARNIVSCTLPDAVGHLPGEPVICAGTEEIASTLPLAEIHRELSARRIPVEYSNSAGDYVCNFTFYSAGGGLLGAFKPPMCGFIHIPYLDSQLGEAPCGDKLPNVSVEVLWKGALCIADTCVMAMRRAQATADIV